MRSIAFLATFLGAAGGAWGQSLLDGSGASPYDPPKPRVYKKRDHVRVVFADSKDAVTAEVVDIRPNGNLVLQAIRARGKKVTRLTGEAVPASIAGGEVRSDRVANLRISVSRPPDPGWLTWLARKLSPF